MDMGEQQETVKSNTRLEQKIEDLGEKIDEILTLLKSETVKTRLE